MVLVALVALVAVASYALTLPPSQRLARFGLALILGGAVGNLIDRATSGFRASISSTCTGGVFISGLSM